MTCLLGCSKPSKTTLTPVDPTEAAARKLLASLTPEKVTQVCGRPEKDWLKAYSANNRWRVLQYKDFEVDFTEKSGRWEYDFAADGYGNTMPDSELVSGSEVRLPCQWLQGLPK